MDIFIADDSSAIQKVVRIAFKDSIFQMSEMESFELLTVKLRTHSPAAILLNPKLPGLKGPGELKQIVGKIPVVLLVGTYDYLDVGEWNQAGFTHLMKKPFDGKELVRLVSGLLGVEASDSISKPGTRPDHQGVFQGIEMSLISSGHFSDGSGTRAGGPHLNQSEDRGKKAFSELELSSINFPQISMNQPRKKNSSSTSIENLAAPSLPVLPLQHTTNSNDFGVDVSTTGQGAGKKLDPSAFAPSLGGSQMFADEFSTDFGTPLSANPSSQGGHLRESDSLDNNTLGLTRQGLNAQGLNTLGGFSSDDIVETGIKSNVDEVLTSSQMSTTPFQMENLIASIWPRVQDLIRNEVRQYLDGQIKAQIPQITKEVITSEIRRLTDEKARIHIDR